MLVSQLNEILEKAKEWAQAASINESDRREIANLVENRNEKELAERFYRDLEFGTGGLRAILGNGTNRLNQYTVKRACKALAKILKKESTRPKIVLSYDSRQMSLEFSRVAAQTLAGLDCEVLLFDNCYPVPLLSFATRQSKAQAGVMITASHNPPEYNGVKVYWSSGAQVTPPYDQEIIEAYGEIDLYQEDSFPTFEKLVEAKKITLIGKEMTDLYHQGLQKFCLSPDLCREEGQTLSIVYTPLHGAAGVSCLRALKEMGFTNVKVVSEQEIPDGKFPTVSSPNPENPEALKMAVDLMKKTKADLAFGSDPDGDRLGVVVNADNGPVFLGGNQIGLLMLHYILERLKETDSLPENSFFIKSIVTSELQASLAAKYGVRCYNTLTGFKWICRVLDEVQASDPESAFLFATEESFGYLHHPLIRDKDGVSSLALMSEVALWYKQKGLNLVEGLKEIYQKFGLSYEELLNLNYEGIEGAKKIERIMGHFRSFNSARLGEEEVLSRRDYLEAKDNIPASNVLSFDFKDGGQLFLRPSGTEPKIKFYIMMTESEGTLEEKQKRAEKRAKDLISFIQNEVRPL